MDEQLAEAQDLIRAGLNGTLEDCLTKCQRAHRVDPERARRPLRERSQAMTTLNVTGLSANRRYRLARETAGFKQEELARMIGVARTTIGEWERGVTEPSASRLVSLADATRQPLDFFIEGLREDLRARRDSNPQPSDWEYRTARTAFTRVLVALSLCQLALDGELRHNGVVQ